MKIFDGHCDVLFKMWDNKLPDLFYSPESFLHSSYNRLSQGRVGVQTMAVFIPPEIPANQRYQAAIEMIDILYKHILNAEERCTLVTSTKELEEISFQSPSAQEEEPLHIILALEGADALQGDMQHLHTFYEKGVRSIGLTWNYRNEVADGVKEPNAGGLTSFGREVVQEMNRLGIAVDVSHLAEKGFWDCVELSSQPIIASHSNARALFDHPRNLYDDQLKAISQTGGLVGITFVPYFLSSKDEVGFTEVLHHMEHMLALGGEDHVAFGSDFDGISEFVQGFEHSGKYMLFIEECQKHYSERVIEKLCFTNWKNYYLTIGKDRY